MYPVKLSALVYDCICETTAKFHEKIFDSGVINHLIPTQNICFQYSDLSGDFFTFQQDNAPAHRARETVQLLTCETPDFIAPALWPANSPDLNPVNYQTRGSIAAGCMTLTS